MTPRPNPPATRPPLRAGASALALLTLGLLTLGSISGCSNLEPWVKPYERERLADPIMNLARDSLPERHRDHVYAVREGARGATGVQGGGCGCN
jgi:hypothetical protein